MSAKPRQSGLLDADVEEVDGRIVVSLKDRSITVDGATFYDAWVELRRAIARKASP